MSTDSLEEIAVLRAALAAAETRAQAAEADAAQARASASSAEALIAHLKLQIEKLRRELYGQRSERTARLLEQMELQLEDLEATAREDDLSAEHSKPQGASTGPRRRPSRQPFPDHLPRERVVIPAPDCCPQCGSSRLARLGEDITETLEVVPRRWKVIQTVREKVSCRDCETISQPPAPFHVTPRGWAGPALLAQILFEKFGQHQPLNRQAERYAREGVPLSLSTLADQVGASAFALKPLHELLTAHVLAANRLHGDDTPVPVLAPGRCATGRIWVYVRDDRPVGGRAPPAALFYYSRNRRGEHPERHLANYRGLLQTDVYSGYNGLYAADRLPVPLLPSFCWAHARRKFFELADITARATGKRAKAPAAVAPLALEAVRRLDALFEIEREVNGLPTEERLAARRERSAPLVEELETWMRNARAGLSRHAPVAKAMDYMLGNWNGFTRFLDDGRLCLTNNAAERALRGLALGRKAWLFAGSDRGGERAAFMVSLIVTARMNDVDPQAWLADVLARIASHPAHRLDELLPWNWKRQAAQEAA